MATAAAPPATPSRTAGPSNHSTPATAGPASVLKSKSTTKIKPPKHVRATDSIRAFLRSKSCYDILPESFRLVVLDNQLSIKKALNALIMNGVVSAPLVDSTSGKYAGMFTLTDIIHLIQYYYQLQATWEAADNDVDTFKLVRLREIEEKLGVPETDKVSLHPDEPLQEACIKLARLHARRIPLIDTDTYTGREIIVSVLTQYRMLKFISINCAQDCANLSQPLGSLGIGTYISSYTHPSAQTSTNPASPNLSSGASLSSSASLSSAASSARLSLSERYKPIAVATLSTPVFDIVHLFSEWSISAVPIIDPKTGVVINMYETVDVIDLVRSSHYKVLDLTVGEALERRQKDFKGIMVCSANDRLGSIMEMLRERRVHRIVIVEDGPDSTEEEDGVAKGGEDGEHGHWPKRRKGRLIGILSLSDILKYLVGAVNIRGADQLERYGPPPGGAQAATTNGHSAAPSDAAGSKTAVRASDETAAGDEAATSADQLDTPTESKP